MVRSYDMVTTSWLERAYAVIFKFMVTRPPSHNLEIQEGLMSVTLGGSLILLLVLKKTRKGDSLP